MGEFVQSLSRISKGYNLYLVVIYNKYGNRATEVLNELFEQVAYDIGADNVIAKILSEEGIREAKRKFEIKHTNWPILLIMQKHPNEVDIRNDSH